MESIEKRWLGACGLSCHTCPIHLRAENVLAFFKSRNVDPDQVGCDGCRSSRDGRHWSSDCRILACCVHQKGLACCSECETFPCDRLDEWASGDEHHQQAVARLRDMKARGTLAWLSEHGFR